jgi:hypothetical protein
MCRTPALAKESVLSWCMSSAQSTIVLISCRRVHSVMLNKLLNIYLFYLWPTRHISIVGLLFVIRSGDLKLRCDATYH